MAKPKVRRVHKVHKGTGPVRLPGMPGIPKAAAVYEQGGWFNFFGGPTQKKEVPSQGQNIPPKSMMPQGGVHTPTPTQPPPPVKKTRYSKTHRPVYVTEVSTGNITKLDYNPSMQQRQQLHEAGYKLTTIKPHKVHQQGFTDDFGITTFNVDGSVSTAPVGDQFERDLQAANAAVDPEQPRSVYAEEDVPRTDVPPNINSILHGTLPPYPPHTRTGPTRIRKKKGKLASGPFAAGDPNSLLRKVFGWGTRE